MNCLAQFDTPSSVCGYATIEMLRRGFQFAAVLLASVLLAMPVMACLVPDGRMTAEEHNCCQKMAHRCEAGVMPSSHSCCRHPVSRQDISVSRIQTIDLSLLTATIAELTSPTLPMTNGLPLVFESLPESPPQTITVLRI
jgi:hypothetical protein